MAIANTDLTDAYNLFNEAAGLLTDASPTK